MKMQPPVSLLRQFDDPANSPLQSGKFKFWIPVLLAFFLNSAWVSETGQANGQDEPTAEQVKFFEEKIRPILNDHCFECHSEEKQESDLRLDSRQSILTGGSSGPAAISGDADDSLIIEVLEYGTDIEMPPDQKLDDEIVDDLRKWINDGLAWPKSKDDDSVKPVTMTDRVDDHRKNHWAYQPLSPHLPRRNDTDSWSRNPIDQMIRAKQVEHKLQPSPEADRITLVHRVYADVLGVPPTYSEVEQVVSDQSFDWYESLVDRLLASPRFGERWGRHWLDVARYADTRGYAFAKDRKYPHAYTYRNYVIDAFNSDKPYDQFVMEQLAADQLELGEDLSPLAGLGFLTVGRKFNNIHDDIDDKIDVVTRGLLGLTVACARCHDHKYDAIPTADYYSLYGVFVSSKEGDLPYIGNRNKVESYQQKKSEANRLKSELDQFVELQRKKIIDQARSHHADYFARIVAPESDLSGLEFCTLPDSELRSPILAAWKKYLRRKQKENHPVWIPWSELSVLSNDKEFSVAFAKKLADWKTKKSVNPLVLQALEQRGPKNLLELADVYGQIFNDVHSAWKKLGENDAAIKKLTQDQQQVGIAIFDDASPTIIQTAQVPSMLSPADRTKYDHLKATYDSVQQNLPPELDRAMVVSDLPKPVNPFIFVRGQAGRPGKAVPRQFVEVLSDEQRQPFTKGSGRLELATEIVDPENPLTARVITNRIWKHYLGKPLVSAASDFGQRSPEPVQIDVLDWLAKTLIDGEFSMKRIHRLILLSATYRQQSKNRTDAFAIDSDNNYFWKVNRKRLEFEPLRDSMLAVSGELDLQMGGKSVEITEAPFSRRRGVYGFIDRQDLPNLLRAFDFASPDSSAAKRTETTVPQQLLFMLNSPFVMDRAKALASQLATTDNPQQNINQLYRIVLSRNPSEKEIAIGTTFLQNGDRQSRLRHYAQLLLLTNEFSFVD